MTSEQTQRMSDEQIAEINERLAKVETNTKFICGALNMVTKERDQLRTDLTEARSQLEEAREALEIERDCIVEELRDDEGVCRSLSHQQRYGMLNTLVSRLSPSPKQGAGGGEG